MKKGEFERFYSAFSILSLTASFQVFVADSRFRQALTLALPP